MTISTISPLLASKGAIPPPDDSPDAGVAWHHGDPFAEQRAATRSVAVVDRSHRGVLAVPGDDRLTWLHALTSQHFTELAADTGTEALVLDAHGHVEHHMVVAHAQDTVWLDTEGERAAELLSYLDSMRFWSKVEPRDASAELAVLSVLGPDTERLLAELGLSAPRQPYAVLAAEGALLRRMPWPGRTAVDLLVPRAELAAWWLRLTGGGARPAGSLAFEALRVESLRARLGIDTDERTIPHEVNWIAPAVHPNKGCYRGQETVAKVLNVGRPPRRMVLLHLDGSANALPETGEPVRLGERVVGRVGSVVQHHELGPIALALLKRSAPVDVELLAGSDEHATQAAVDPRRRIASFALIYPAWGVMQAGEIKRANSLSGNMKAIVGAEVFAFVTVAIISALLVSRIGNEFLFASGSLFYGGSDEALEVPPFFGFFAALMSSSPILIWVAFVMFIALVRHVVPEHHARRHTRDDRDVVRPDLARGRRQGRPAHPHADRGDRDLLGRVSDRVDPLLVRRQLRRAHPRPADPEHHGLRGDDGGGDRVPLPQEGHVLVDAGRPIQGRRHPGHVDRRRRVPRLRRVRRRAGVARRRARAQRPRRPAVHLRLLRDLGGHLRELEDLPAPQGRARSGHGLPRAPVGVALVTRLFFCTDLHGSEICFRKFLHAGSAYDAGVVIMGGDCTGKMIIPVVGSNEDGWTVEWAGQTVRPAPEELETIERQIANNGLYPVRMSPDEVAALNGDEDRLRDVFERTMLDTLAGWMELARERMMESGRRVIVTPGNDDELTVDDVLQAAPFVEAAEGRVVRIDEEHEMISLGWSNPTPWDTPRECSEAELAGKIRTLAEQIEDMDRAIFNIHVPPHGTGLDSAPEIEDGNRVKRGGTIMASVGSTAVRDAILEYQPLLSLHGHIHESRGVQKLGRTLCINPGSAYSDWTLQGVLVDLKGAKVKRYVPTTG